MATIIVIDDEPGIRGLLRNVLEAAGHVVSDYADGRGAIEQIGRASPDLLITDIFMPEAEGLETIRRVRALQPEVPIIAISGVLSYGHDYLHIASQFGAAATLEKPFNAAELLAAVERLVAG